MFEQFIPMPNPSLKVVRVPNGPPALRDMTNMTKLEAILKFTRSRHSNRSINLISSQGSKISHRNYVAKNFHIAILHDNNKNKQLNDRSYFD